MSKVVFILGAGASKAAGAPLMNDFFDQARRLLAAGKVKRFENDFSTVFKAIDALQMAHSKSSLDVYNLESVFNAFEFAEFLDIDRALFGPELVISLKKVIAHTIEKTMPYPIATHYGNGFLTPHPSYQHFAELIKSSVDKKCSVAIINFNYDIGVDFALLKSRLTYNYCVDPGAIFSNAISLLKLHGSLNWRKCTNCGKVGIIHINDYFDALHRSSFNRQPPGNNICIGTDNFASICHTCKQPLETFPFIVPPSWNKQEHYKVISPVWQCAAKELKEASCIFICGYSLPPTDQFFQNLYALGTMGGGTLHRFQVYNPDTSGLTEDRFRKLIGTGASDRFDYIAKTGREHEGTFEYAIGGIKQLLTESVWNEEEKAYY
jgi:hypothetical protein